MAAVDDSGKNDAGTVVDSTGTDSVPKRRDLRRKPLLEVYVALLLFMVIYCARPEDWIPGLSGVPLAKIIGIFGILALVFSLRRRLERLPREVLFLSFLVGQLFLSSALSPVWRGGAFRVTLNFTKVLMIVLAIIIAVNTLQRLRMLLLTQAISVSAIAAVAIWKGHLILGRLEGVLGGNYSDPNDMALAIVMSLPLCLALLILSRNMLWKILWSISMIVMIYAVFLTGSRSGFLALLVVAAVCIWEFAIRGGRRYLVGLAVLAGLILWQSTNGVLIGRLKGTINVSEDTAAAFDSAQARKQLFWQSIKVTEDHPFVGVGPGNFDQISGQWHTTHNSLTLMSSEGGIPALVLYVLILWCGFKNLRATKRLVRRRTESNVLAGAFVASLAGYAVGSLFLSAAYVFSPYFLVAYTTVLLSITRKSVTQSRNFAAAKQVTLEKQFSLADARA